PPTARNQGVTDPAQLVGQVLVLSLALWSSPDDADLYCRRGRALARLGWRDLGLADYSRALELRPDHAEASLSPGEEYLRRRQWQKAIADLNRATEYPALRANALVYRCLANIHLGRNGDSEADRDLLRGAYPDFTATCSQFGDLYARQNDTALAVV